MRGYSLGREYLLWVFANEMVVTPMGKSLSHGHPSRLWFYAFSSSEHAYTLGPLLVLCLLRCDRNVGLLLLFSDWYP